MAGTAIRKMTLSDCEAANSILAAAFGRLNPAGIAERELALAPKTCFIAIDDGAPAGLVCAVQYGPLAYIGPMGVKPEWQGKGIGRLLLRRLIDCLEERGCLTMLLDATEAGEALYLKAGFVETARTFDMVREPGAGITKLPALDKLDEALALDREVFAADREPMLRRLVEQEGAALFTHADGYLVSQTRVLGPFAALNPTAAGSLIDKALEAGAVASRILVPVENRDARRLLLPRGFQVQREVKHMRRGKPVAMRRDLIYGLASFALG